MKEKELEAMHMAMRDMSESLKSEGIEISPEDLEYTIIMSSWSY